MVMHLDKARLFMNELVLNIDKVHTTELGILRISRNLKLVDVDVVEWCKSKILDKNAKILQQGKNWYVFIDGKKIVVNKSSYTIITAHIVKD